MRLAHQAHFLRRSLELEIVRTLALTPDRQLVTRLNVIVAQQQALAEAQDFQEFSAADRAFHQQLFDAAGTPELWTLIRSRSGHIDRLRHLHLPTPGKAQEILGHHRLLVKAIAGGQPDQAQQHIRDHLSGTLAHIEDIRARYPTYIRD
jgi:DNA-binding GntR family transcriptional regulator